MEKIIQITINSTLFGIEEPAYLKLSSYLNEIKTTFEGDSSGQEIIKDIEARIAEHLKAGGGEYVTLDLVEAIIIKMGVASDLKGSDAVEGQKETPKENADEDKKRKLYRDEENAILGGVCSGIAAYIDVDPTWVRLSFIAITFLGFGLIIPIYILLWLIIPPAATIDEKLEMHGSSVNLKSIVGEVRSRINDLRENHKCCDKRPKGVECSETCKKNSNILKQRTFKIIEKITVVFGVVLRILLGSIITILGLIILIGFTATISLIISAGFPLGLESVISSLQIEPYITALVVAGITAFLIPAILIFYGGVHILTGRTTKRKTHGFLTLGIWMVAITTIIFSFVHIGVKFATYSKDNNIPKIEYVNYKKRMEITNSDLKQIGKKIELEATAE